MPQLFGLPQVVPLSSFGAILPGSKLFFFQTGTSTPQNVYQDIDLTVAHSQPVVADASGVFDPIYLDGSAPAYRVRLTDSSDVQQWQLDGVPSSNNLAQTLRIKGATPEVIFEETDASAGNKKSRIRVSSEVILWELLNDAESISTEIIRIPRSGITLGSILLGGIPPIAGNHVVRLGSLNRNTTTTLANDPVLQLPLLAGVTQLVEGQFFFNAGSTGAGMGIKLALDFTGTDPDFNSPFITSHVNGSGAITRAPMINATPLTFSTLSTTAKADCVRFSRVIRPSVAGNLILQWAQNSSNADNLTLHLGSWMTSRRIE